MEAGTFDRLARMLAGRLSRRAGLATGLAALAAGIPGAGARRKPAGRDGEASPRRAEVIDEKRPCGPKPSDNRCTRDADCCTSFCKLPKGKGKSQTGRCRCVKPGKKCKDGQKCCGGATCRNRTCTPASKCTVCASGCQFTDVNAAYAAAAPGATITIAPGSYNTGILVTKSATLAACGTSGEVILQADPGKLSPDSYAFVIAEDGVSTTPYTITLKNLTLRGNGVDTDDTLLSTYTKGNVSFIVEGGTARDTDTVFYLAGGNHVITGMTTDPTVDYVFYADFDDTGSGSVAVSGCQFQSRNVTFYVDGNGDPGQRAATPFTLSSSTFTSTTESGLAISGGVSTVTGCTISNCGNGGCYLHDGDFTLTNCTISGNNSADSYGGIYLFGDTYDTTLTIAGTTVVTGNTVALGPAGIGVNTSGPGTMTVNGASTANVNGNTGPYQCGSWDGASWSDKPTCSF